MSRTPRRARRPAPSPATSPAPSRTPPPFEPGDIVPVPIDRLAAGTGDGVGRHASGLTVFCEGAVPGEIAHVLIDRVQPRWARGTLFSLERAHPERHPPACDVADTCGGCRFHGLPYGLEVAWKTEAVRSSLQRIAPRVEWPTPVVAPDTSPHHYRERARLGVAEDGTTGFRAARSHRVVPSERCPILHPALDDARRAAAACLDLSESAELMLEWDEVRSGAALTVLADALGAETHDRLRALGDDARFTTVVHAPGAGPRLALVGDGRVHRRFGRAVVRVPTGEFSQANRRHTASLVAAALDAMGPLDGARVLELFAGSGTFTFELLARGAHVVAADIAGPALDAAREASARHDLELRLRCVELNLLDAWDVSLLAPPPQIVLVDPPRAGLSRALVERLRALGPLPLVYVSCDPATMARDLDRLGVTRVERLHLLDLFPRTPHVEAVAVAHLPPYEDQSPP